MLTQFVLLCESALIGFCLASGGFKSVPVLVKSVPPDSERVYTVLY